MARPARQAVAGQAVIRSAFVYTFSEEGNSKFRYGLATGEGIDTTWPPENAGTRELQGP